MSAVTNQNLDPQNTNLPEPVAGDLAPIPDDYETRYATLPPAVDSQSGHADAPLTEPLAPQHPLTDQLIEVINLKTAKDYASADNLCWKMLGAFNISEDTYADIANKELVSQIPEDDRFIVAQIAYELGLSGEARVRMSVDRENQHTDRLTGQAIKMYLLANDLEPHFPPAAFHLASVITHMKHQDLESLRGDFELPLLPIKIDSGKVFTDFQEQCLARLLTAVDSPPYALNEDHFSGEALLPQSNKFKLPTDATDPGFTVVNELSWMLSDASKLSINIANYYRHTPSDDKSALPQYLDLTRQFAGTLLNMFDIPREQSEAWGVIGRIKGSLGSKAKTVVSALTNLASAAQMDQNLPLAREWYKTALLVEPGNAFASQRLEALTTGQRRFDPHAVSVLISNIAAEEKPAAAPAREWAEDFEALKLDKLHGEIIASISRQSIVQSHREILDSAIEAAKILRVIFSDKEGSLADSYLTYLGKDETQEALWEVAFGAPGLLSTQSHLAILDLCVERKLLDNSKRLQDVKEKLGTISDTYVQSFDLPSLENQYPFYQQVLNLVIADLQKKR